MLRAGVRIELLERVTYDYYPVVAPVARSGQLDALVGELQRLDRHVVAEGA
jgi:hypothetical protein